MINLPGQQYGDVALLASAIEAYNAEQRVEQVEFYTSAARGRPHIRQRVNLPIDFQYLGEHYRFKVSRPGSQHYCVSIDDRVIEVYIEQPEPQYIMYGGQRYRVFISIDGPDYSVDIMGVKHQMLHKQGGIVRAPAPAVVISLVVAPGDHVEVGKPLAVVESMKMEMAITAPFAGQVSRLFVAKNVQVDKGAPLLQIEPPTWDDKPVASQRVRFSDTLATTAHTPRERCQRLLEALRCLLLGYDIDQSDSRRLLKEQLAVYNLVAPDDRELLLGEDEILSIFTDICSLFRRELDPVEAEMQEGLVHSAEHDLLTYLRSRNTRIEQLSPLFLAHLQRALMHYGVGSLDPSPELDESLLLIYKSHQRVEQQLAIIIAILERRLEYAAACTSSITEETHSLLDRLLLATQERYQAVNDLAREVLFRSFEEPLFEQARKTVYEEMLAHLAYLDAYPTAANRDELIHILVDCPQPLQNLLSSRFSAADKEMRQLILEVLTRRYYRIRHLENFEYATIAGQTFASAAYHYQGAHNICVTTFARYEDLDVAARNMAHMVGRFPAEYTIVVDFYLWWSEPSGEAESLEQRIQNILKQTDFARRLRRIVVAVSAPGKGLGIASTQHFTYRPGVDGYQEEQLYRGLHPMMGKRLHIWRLANFEIKRLPSVEDVYLFYGIARNNSKDERLFALAEVRDMTPVRDKAGKIVQIPHLARMLMEALDGIRRYQSHLPAHKRLSWNRVLLYVWPPLGVSQDEFQEIMQKLWYATERLGLERIVIHARVREPGTDELHERMLHFSNPGGRDLTLRVSLPVETPIATLSEYRQKVVQLRQRGLIYPYELIEMLTPGTSGIHTRIPPGDFTEYDLDEANRLVPVERAYGKNRAGIVVGIIRHYTTKYPEGMRRVILLSDASRSLGAIAEPECRRVIEAINLAERLQIPLEWFPISAGARISMESGTENMDWVARALRRIIEFTQAGGEINVIVNGINVGGQPYWNAGATILMHTRGILIMTPDGAMVLTGKQSLDYSGGVSAEDNYGIGGYERIMGPNGQAQYFVPDLSAACQVLMRHYDHTYVVSGERFPRRAQTADPVTRNICDFPYVSTRAEESDLTCIGDLFSEEKNAGRKRTFNIRTVMTSFIDADHEPLERWGGMRDAGTVVVWDAHIGGYPVALLGIESHPLPRYGFIPGDGPEQWTAGTLFPMSAKKAARAINATSGNRPLVVITNLTGFDGSPESLRNFELEYGAEIARSITNFKGPIIICVISRFHGGSFVVFSKALNENLEIAAVEGSYASVIGGIPAAAVVFARDVEARVKNDPRVKDVQMQLASAQGTSRATLQIRLNEVTAMVRSEKVGEVASEFDHVHDVQRARRVGSIDYVIPPEAIRPYLVEALERGVQKELQRWQCKA